MKSIVELDGDHLRLTFFDEKEEPHRLDITAEVRFNPGTTKDRKGSPAVPPLELDEELKQVRADTNTLELRF